MIKKVTLAIRRLPKWLLLIGAEAWPVVVLILAVAIEFAHIANSSWLQVFLYNGDSLTLPVIRQALAHKEPFLWVSSSQFLLFPEGMFYAISSFLTRSVRASLVFNGGLNLVGLYLLLRWITSTFANIPRATKQLFALGGCLLLILYMLLERQPLVNSSAVATLFIFSSYYYGVILAGLFLVGLAFRQLQVSASSRLLTRNQLFLCLVALCIAMLTVFSDPIFIILFLVPFMITAGLVFVLGGLKFRDALLICLPALFGSGIGYVGRSFFKSYIGEPLGGHIVTAQIPGTLTVFHGAISTDLHSKSGAIELGLIAAVMGFSALYALWWMYQKSRGQRQLDGRLLLISLLAVIAPIGAVLFSIFSGSLVTRYLLPLIIFPLVGLLAALTSAQVNRFRKGLAVGSAAIITVVVVWSLASIGGANRVLASTFPDAQCLATALSNQPAVGAAQYWDARPLGVYGRQDEEVLQIKADLSPYLWQSNLGSFQNKKLSFLVVDKALTSPGAMLPDNPSIPPAPTRIYSCPNIYVYMYTPGTQGYKQLNNRVEKSYGRLHKTWSAGKTAELY